MNLPLLLSVPHAGLEIPPEVAGYAVLTPEQIAEDGDAGAREIYSVLETEVAAFVTTDIARAFVDLNREESDIGGDGVVKTATCWNVPVYRRFPPAEIVEALLARWHRPYHARLSELAPSVKFGIDGHTMAPKGPPVGPDPGRERPAACLGNADSTCPRSAIESLAAAMERTLGRPVSINDPFRGGHIIRSHAAELPWIQMEISRAPFLDDREKGIRILSALRDWVKEIP